MTRKALRALKGSINKWRLIVLGEGVNEGWKNCPLCLAFPDLDCKGCPVQRRTRETECRDTPYNDYVIAKRNDDKPAMQTAARAEYDFLKSLLPKGER